MTVLPSRRFRGHPAGGLLAPAILLLLALSGCASKRAGVGAVDVGSTSSERFAELLNPLTTYRLMGFVTGGRAFNAVGRFAYLAGPGDSTLVLFGSSFPNSALQFQQTESGFVAEYRVLLTWRREDQEVGRVTRLEQVRVASFRETARTDESVVFQLRQPLSPGAYVAEIEIRDLASGKGLRESIDLLVPDLRAEAQAVSAPIVVYRVDPRSSRDQAPSLILNPRATTPFGGESPLVYLEAYDGGDTLALEVRDANSETVWSDMVQLSGDAAIRSAVLSIPAERLPVGAFEVRATLLPDHTTAAAPILVGLSNRWILANFKDVLDLLRYATSPGELDSLRNAPPDQRAERWRRFWERKDPLPATPENEFFDEYFGRVREANQLFAEQQRAGWLTDRGEVYVTLGSPDAVFTSSEIGPGARVRWLYDRSLGFELQIDFIDRSGFGTYEMTPDSRSRFRQAVARIRDTA